MMINKSLENLDKSITNPGSGTGLIKSIIDFDKNSDEMKLIFSPTLDEIHSSIENAIDELITTCTKPY